MWKLKEPGFRFLFLNCEENKESIYGSEKLGKNLNIVTLFFVLLFTRMKMVQIRVHLWNTMICVTRMEEWSSGVFADGYDLRILIIET